MNLTITQQNVHLLLYSSELYARLENESTKAWHLGPVALYQDFKAEI